MSDNEDKNLILEDEKELVLDHDYDGIQELDHPLPHWWVGTFVGGFIFAALYLIFYEVLGAPGIQETYEKNMAIVLEKRELRSQDVGLFEIEVYREYLGPQGIAEGKEVYEWNCLACHGENGAGDIGPNLTDNYWKNVDGTAEGVYEVIVNGREDLGMPGWADLLSKDEMYAATAYVRSLRGQEVENPKAPEGEYFDPPPEDE